MRLGGPGGVHVPPGPFIANGITDSFFATRGIARYGNRRIIRVSRKEGILGRFEHYFLLINKWAITLSLSAMAVIVFSNVTLRYTTNYSIIWAEEVARYLMIWMTFLGAGMVLRVGGHVAISNLQELLNPKLQRMLRLLIVGLLLSFSAIMIWMGIEYMYLARFQVTPATRIPFSYIYAAMPIGFALFVAHMLLIVRGFIADNNFIDPDEAESGIALAVRGD